jgi:hypothetical protein
MRIKQIILLIIILFSFYQCNTIKKKETNKNSNESLVDFKAIVPQHCYFYFWYSYSLNYPDTMDIKLIGKDVRINEEDSTFCIDINSNYHREGNIFVINNKKQDTIETVRIYGIFPDIQITFGGRLPDNIISNEYFTMDRMTAELVNTDFSLYYEVVSYSMQIQSGDSILTFSRSIPWSCYDYDNWVIGEEIEEECEFFSKEQQAAIENIKGAQIVAFTNIVIQLDSNHQKTLEPAYWIVEEKKE